MKWFTCLILLFLSQSVFCQKNVGFKLYLGSISGADVNFWLYDDHTYEFSIARFRCNSCDFKQMTKNVSQKGRWVDVDSKIKLTPYDTVTTLLLERIGDTRLRPLFFVNREFNATSDPAIKRELLENQIKSEVFQFRLIYETYPNGVVKKATYRSGLSKNAYEMEFKETGQATELVRLKKGSRTLMK